MALLGRNPAIQLPGIPRLAFKEQPNGFQVKRWRERNHPAHDPLKPGAPSPETDPDTDSDEALTIVFIQDGESVRDRIHVRLA